MRKFRTTLGVMAIVFFLCTFGTILFAISNSHFGRRAESLVIFNLAAIVAWYFGAQFLFLVKFGFYTQENANKYTKATFLIPLSLIIIPMAYMGFEYQRDQKAFSESANVSGEPKDEVESKEPINFQQVMYSNLTFTEKFKTITIGKALTPEIAKIGYEVVTNGYKNGHAPLKPMQLKDYYINFRFNEKMIRDTFPRRKEFVGFLHDQRLLIFRNTDRDSVFTYFAIDEINGHRIDDIPLIKNDNSDLYSNVYFEKSGDAIDLRIRIWYHDTAGQYYELTNELLPLSNKAVTNLSYDVTDLFWEENSFYFTLTEKTDSVVNNVNLKLNVNFSY
jgi:hypothetical protein